MAMLPRAAGRALRSSRLLTNPPLSSARYKLLYPDPSKRVSRSFILGFRRHFQSSVSRLQNAQQAPSAQAYIQSGIVSQNDTLVDVKKVLVIGSGGLSIGQAGEFDYSGKTTPWQPHSTMIGYGISTCILLRCADKWFQDHKH